MDIPKKEPWKQETIWVRRDETGIIIGVAESVPAGQAYIPASEPAQQK